MKKAIFFILLAIVLILIFSNAITAYLAIERGKELNEVTTELQKFKYDLADKEEEMRRTVAILQQESSQLVALEQKKRQDLETKLNADLVELRTSLLTLQAQQEAKKEAEENSKKLDELVTIEGRIYRDVEVTDIKQNGITIMHRDGGATLDFDKLPLELQNRFRKQMHQAGP